MRSECHGITQLLENGFEDRIINQHFEKGCFMDVVGSKDQI